MDGQEAIVIASAARTPVGSFNGGLASIPAHELGKIVITEALKRANTEPGEVSEVILGQVLAAAQGQNPARQASILASLPIETTAMTINFVCGSGLRSVAMAAQAIRNGDSDIVVAGGQENMSLAPHAAYLRSGTKMGCLQRLSHGHHGGERCAAMADYARAAGRVRRRFAE
jgi:acetyl-CoA C-acetyltransferase